MDELEQVISNHAVPALKAVIDWMTEQTYGAAATPQDRLQVKRAVLGLGYHATHIKIAESAGVDTSTMEAVIERLRKRFPTLDDNAFRIASLGQAPRMLA